ncbi:MAG: glycosyltransferase involved in cell wall biosynthesis [Polaribacter sp.]|jgi:glycosyltransferase involved in cell wall biosynthesis
MKIAILADPLDNQSAGVHTYTKQLVEALIKYDTQNEYLLIREKKDPNLTITQIAIPNIRLPIGFTSLRLFFIIPYILRVEKVDAVLEPAHFGPFNLPKRIKRITMIHDLTPLLFPQYHRLHSQLLQRIFLKRILRKADLILSNSENTSKDLVQFFPFAKSKIKTILLGRDTEFQPTPSRTFLLKNEIADPYFLSTGTIEPRKNLNVLLEAYRLFRDQTKEKVLLILVGKKGWKTDDFFSKLKIHPYRKDIILTGFVVKNELIELYSHALALVYPSFYEGFGLPVLESLSCGTRVICSNSSSFPEVGGSVSLYFQPEDAKELLGLLQTVYQDFKLSINHKTLLFNQAYKFSWMDYVKQLEEATL